MTAPKIDTKGMIESRFFLTKRDDVSFYSRVSPKRTRCKADSVQYRFTSNCYEADNSIIIIFFFLLFEN